MKKQRKKMIGVYFLVFILNATTLPVHQVRGVNSPELPGKGYNIYWIGGWTLGPDFRTIYPDTVRNILFIGAHGGVNIVDNSVVDSLSLLSSITTKWTVEEIFYQSSRNLLFIADSAGGLEIWNVSDPRNPFKEGSCKTLGFANGLFVSGDYAYVSCDGGWIVVVDVSDPSNPEEIAYLNVSGSAKCLTLSGNYLYVSDYGYYLRIYDVSNPANIFQVGTCDIDNAVEIYIKDSLAYVAERWNGLSILNISNPVSPTKIGSCAISGRAVSVFALGNYAYVAYNTDLEGGFEIIDVSDPSNPYKVGYWKKYYSYILDMYVSDGLLAYVSDQSFELLRIIDVSSPECVEEIGRYDSFGDTRDVVVDGDYAYIADGYPGVRVLDISKPTNPIEVGFCDTPGFARGLFISDGYIYVADDIGGLRILDRRNPVKPVEIGGFSPPGSSKAVFVQDTFAYLAMGDSGLCIVNVGNPSAPFLVGRYDTPGFANNVYVAGYYAYVADKDSGLRVVDVSDATNPYEVSFFKNSCPVYSVYIDSNYSYIANGDNGLRILDISNPENPFEVGYYDSLDGVKDVCLSGHYASIINTYTVKFVDVSDPAHCKGLGVEQSSSFNAKKVYYSGDYAYISAGGKGMRIIFVGDPHEPHQVGSFSDPPSGIITDMAVKGNYVYLLKGKKLLVIDITNPLTSQRVGSYDLSDFAKGLIVVGDYAYVADYTRGLRILDISSPENPYEVGYYDTPGYTWDVFYSDSLVYLADGSGGFEIVDVTNPASPTLVSRLNSPPYKARGIYMHDGMAYIADYDESNGGLEIIDVSDPQNPMIMGYYSMRSLFNLVVLDGYAYVTNGFNIYVIDVHDASNPSLYSSYSIGTPSLSLYNGCLLLGKGYTGFRVFSLSHPGRLSSVGFWEYNLSSPRVENYNGYFYVSNGSNGFHILKFQDSTIASPENLLANGSNPSPLTLDTVFTITWNNPEDISGIWRAFIKIGSPPEANFDTTATYIANPSEINLIDTVTGFKPLYLWLQDCYGNVDYKTAGRVDLRRIGGVNVRQISGTEFNQEDTIHITLEIIDSSEFLDGKVYFRKYGTTAFNNTEFNLIDQTDTSWIVDATLPDSPIRGFEYYCMVELCSGRGEVLGLSDSPLKITITGTATINTGKCNYRMISFPCIVENSSVLEENLGHYDKSRWRAFYWENGQYSEYPEVPSPTEGHALWLITSGKEQITATIKSFFGDGDYFAIPLDPGWNQIGNPFSFCVDLYDCMVRKGDSTFPISSQDWVESRLVRYERPFYTSTRFLNPYEGYWIKNKTSTTVYFLVPPREIWRKHGIYKEDLGAYGRIWIDTDRDNVWGIDSSASDKIDKHDYSSCPPLPVKSPSLYFVCDGEKLDYDIKKGRPNVWTLKLDDNSGTVNLFWSADKFPEDAKLYLLDKTTGILVDMKEDTTLALTGNRELAIFLDSLPTLYYGIPSIHILSNPAYKVVNLIVHLSSSSSAVVEVYDLKGALVFQKKMKVVGIGVKNEVVMEVDFSPNSSGIYFYRVKQKGKYIGNGKVVVIR